MADLQETKKNPVNAANSHIANMGKMLEEMELRIRAWFRSRSLRSLIDSRLQATRLRVSTSRRRAR